MKIWIICGFIALSFIPMSSKADESEIIVTGTGNAVATPDYATLEIYIQFVAQNAADAVKMTANLYEKIVRALVERGLKEKDVATTSYSVRQHWETKKDHEREFVGYMAKHRVLIRVQKLDKVGEVIDASVNAGVDQIGGLKFESSKVDSVEQSALNEAVRQARKRAETMANAAGGHLGSLIELTTESQTRSPLPSDMSVSEVAVETQLAPGDRIVKATVLGRWKFVEDK